jgi:hypothetical protein
LWPAPTTIASYGATILSGLLAIRRASARG